MIHRCACLLFVILLNGYAAGQNSPHASCVCEQCLAEDRLDVEQSISATHEPGDGQLLQPVSYAVSDLLGADELGFAESEDSIRVGGALRFQYVYRDFSSGNRKRLGDSEFDLFRINVDGSSDDLLISAEYRWYSFQDVIHHGWVGYDFPDYGQLQVGVTKKPFGLLPFGSHSFWFAVPYFLGFEDDYDIGLKLEHAEAPWNLQAAFFKNAEYGNPARSARYSFDLVTSGNQQNEETNQGNLRLAYSWGDEDTAKLEMGVSGEVGQVFNRTTERNGSRWAAALHLDGRYGPWQLQLETIAYQFTPENPAGVDPRTVQYGAFTGTYSVASEGTVYVANVAREVHQDFPGVDQVLLYYDFSYLDKREASFQDSILSIAGCSITAGKVVVYIDVIASQNMIFFDAPSNAMGEGRHDGFSTRFNVNVGYYF